MSDLPTKNDTAAHSLPDNAQLQYLVDLHQEIFDSIPISLVVFEFIAPLHFRFVTANQIAFQDGGHPRTIMGHPLADVFTPDEAARTNQRLQACLDGEALRIEESYTLPNGTFWLDTHYIRLPVRPDHPACVLLFINNITERKQREAAERAHQEAIIEHQQATLAELSTPLLSISDTTVVMPIVGTVDSRRIQHIMDALLTGVAERHATHVILDITGVQIVDTQVANSFLHASQAVGLLGARVILTGIRPDVAHTLVSLGVDLSSIITRSSLQSGIAYAMQNERRTP